MSPLAISKTDALHLHMVTKHQISMGCLCWWKGKAAMQNFCLEWLNDRMMQRLTEWTAYIQCGLLHIVHLQYIRVCNCNSTRWRCQCRTHWCHIVLSLSCIHLQLHRTICHVFNWTRVLWTSSLYLIEYLESQTCLWGIYHFFNQ